LKIAPNHLDQEKLQVGVLMTSSIFYVWKIAMELPKNKIKDFHCGQYKDRIKFIN